MPIRPIGFNKFKQYYDTYRRVATAAVGAMGLLGRNIGVQQLAQNATQAIFKAKGPTKLRASKTKMSQDGGTIESKDSVHKNPLDNQVYIINPRGMPWTMKYTDPRSLIQRLANPMFQTYASATVSALASADGLQTVTENAFLTATDVQNIRTMLYHHTAVAQGTVGGPGGLSGQLHVANSANDAQNVMNLYTFLERYTFRNRTNVDAHMILEEWICRRDCDATQNPMTLNTSNYTINEDNAAAIDTLVASVQWQTGGATTCRVAAITDPGERIHGQPVNVLWKKLKTTSVILSPGRVVQYIMGLKHFSSTPTMEKFWSDEGVTYAAGMSRVLVIYLKGQFCGSATVAAISYADVSVIMKKEHFCAYSGNIHDATRRDITYLTAMAQPWVDIATADQATTNEETDAAEAGIDTDQ